MRTFIFGNAWGEIHRGLVLLQQQNEAMSTRNVRLRCSMVERRIRQSRVCLDAWSYEIFYADDGYRGNSAAISLYLSSNAFFLIQDGRMLGAHPTPIALTVCWLAISAASFAHASSIKGRLLSIRDRINVIWIRGEFCGSQRMCEGVLYGGGEVVIGDGKVVVLDRLVLLSLETTDCLQSDAYWAMLAVTEEFSGRRTGRILGHRYEKITHEAFIASEVDLTVATDKSMGFAADGVAYLGETVLSVKFAEPFPEDRHLKAFCDQSVSGFDLITEKRIDFRIRANFRDQK